MAENALRLNENAIFYVLMCANACIFSIRREKRCVFYAFSRFSLLGIHETQNISHRLVVTMSRFARICSSSFRLLMRKDLTGIQFEWNGNLSGLFSFKKIWHGFKMRYGSENWKQFTTNKVYVRFYGISTGKLNGVHWRDLLVIGV